MQIEFEREVQAAVRAVVPEIRDAVADAVRREMSDRLVTVEEAPPTTIGYGGGLEGRLLVVPNAADAGVA